MYHCKHFIGCLPSYYLATGRYYPLIASNNQLLPTTSRHYRVTTSVMAANWSICTLSDAYYEVNQSLAIKPLRDDFIKIYFGKNQTTIGKHSHRILVTIPYFHKIPIGFFDLKISLKCYESPSKSTLE